MAGCGFCHTCGAKLRLVLDGDEYCDECAQYRRYRSHGWVGWYADAPSFCLRIPPVEAMILDLGVSETGVWHVFRRRLSPIDDLMAGILKFRWQDDEGLTRAEARVWAETIWRHVSAWAMACAEEQNGN